MKRLLLLVLLLSSVVCADESVLMRKLRPAVNNGQDRSLKDILAQHGGRLKPGISIITVDGVLDEETPAAVTMAKLKRRATEFKIASDKNLLPSLLSVRTDNYIVGYEVVPLLDYITAIYGQQESPLVAFIADVLREKEEVAALTTESLKLLGDKECRTGASEVMRQVGEYTKVLVIVEKTLARLWREISKR